MVNLEEVKEKKQSLEEIVEKHNLMFLVLYGSVAKGKENSKSDLDFAALKKEKPTVKEITELNCELMDLFSGEIDAKFLNQKSSFFKHQVMKDSIFLAGDKRSYHSFKMYAFRDYCDSFELMDLREKMTNNRLKDLSNI